MHLQRFACWRLHGPLAGCYRSIYTTCCRESRTTAKRARFERRELLRANRRDPEMERKARKGTLLVPLDEVAEEYRQFVGRHHSRAIGEQFGVYSDVFGTIFLPSVVMTIQYGQADTVRRGNIIAANKCIAKPSISLPPVTGTTGDGTTDDTAGNGDHLWTLIMTNPDGNLAQPTSELLHWMVVNISGNSLSGQLEVYPYLPPIPPEGTGYHRYLFALYKHKKPLKTSDLLRNPKDNWLQQRSFSSSLFLRSHPELVPCGFNLFQTKWDDSVKSTYQTVLNWPEPIYKVDKPLTKRRLNQINVKELRQNLYQDML